MQIPNAVWLSIIATAQMIITQTYPDYWWSPVALAALVALGKLIQVKSTEAAATARGAAPQDSALKRWLVG